MTARRILAGVALLFTACTTAACAQVVAGTGTVAADVPAGGGGLGTPTATGSTPSPTESASSSPSSSSSSSSSSSGPSPTSSGSGSEAPSPVCQALDKSAVETAFGSGVTFGRSSSSGCQIRADDGRSMIVAVFDYLKLSEYKKADTTDLTVAGNPAVKTATTIIYVSRGKDPNGAGLVAAYFAALRDGGDAVAIKILELVVPKFPK